MKRVFLMAVCVMACVVGANAQTNEENVPETVEICKAKDGKTVSCYNMQIDESTGEVSFVIEYDAKAGDLWQLCRMWLAENVKQYNQVKQIEDKAEGMLMVNCTLPLKVEGHNSGSSADLSRWEGSQTWKMTVKCKDQRFRVQLSEYASSWKVSAKSNQFGWMELLTRMDLNYNETVFNIDKELFLPEYKKSVAYLAHSIGEYIGKKAGADDDF